MTTLETPSVIDTIRAEWAEMGEFLQWNKATPTDAPDPEEFGVYAGPDRVEDLSEIDLHSPYWVTFMGYRRYMQERFGLPPEDMADGRTGMPQLMKPWNAATRDERREWWHDQHEQFTTIRQNRLTSYVLSRVLAIDSRQIIRALDDLPATPMPTTVRHDGSGMIYNLGTTGVAVWRNLVKSIDVQAGI